MPRMTEAEFTACMQTLNVGDRTREIAHGVLVKGRPQTEFVTEFGITKGAVSQAVRRVWEAHCNIALPEGLERVEAVLPAHRAFIVRQWAEQAKKSRK